jgi:hypothetical protein
MGEWRRGSVSSSATHSETASRFTSQEDYEHDALQAPLAINV